MEKLIKKEEYNILLKHAYKTLFYSVYNEKYDKFEILCKEYKKYSRSELHRHVDEQYKIYDNNEYKMNLNFSIINSKDEFKEEKNMTTLSAKFKKQIIIVFYLINNCLSNNNNGDIKEYELLKEIVPIYKERFNDYLDTKEVKSPIIDDTFTLLNELRNRVNDSLKRIECFSISNIQKSKQIKNNVIINEINRDISKFNKTSTYKYKLIELDYRCSFITIIIELLSSYKRNAINVENINNKFIYKYKSLLEEINKTISTSVLTREEYVEALRKHEEIYRSIEILFTLEYRNNKSIKGNTLGILNKLYNIEKTVSELDVVIPTKYIDYNISLSSIADYINNKDILKYLYRYYRNVGVKDEIELINDDEEYIDDYDEDYIEEDLNIDMPKETNALYDKIINTKINDVKTNILDIKLSEILNDYGCKIVIKTINTLIGIFSKELTIRNVVFCKFIRRSFEVLLEYNINSPKESSSVYDKKKYDNTIDNWIENITKYKEKIIGNIQNKYTGLFEKGYIYDNKIEVEQPTFPFITKIKDKSESIVNQIVDLTFYSK